MRTRSELLAAARRSSRPQPWRMALALSLFVAASFVMGQVALAREAHDPVSAAWTQIPTPVMAPVNPGSASRPQPKAIATPRPQIFPAELQGMILFLSDMPVVDTSSDFEDDWLMDVVLAYAIDPVTGQIGRLNALWPYWCARGRDAYSANRQYQALVRSDEYNDYDYYSPYWDWEDPIIIVEPTETPPAEPEESAAAASSVAHAPNLHAAQVGTEEDDTGYASYNACSWGQCRIYYYDRVFAVTKPATFFGRNPYAHDDAWDPAWSPVSDQVAFVGNESGNDEIYVVAKDRWPPQRLTANTWEWDKHPSWSPDGAQIVFMSNRTGTQQIWLMDADGAGQRALTDWTFEAWDPVWVKYVGEDGCP